MIARLLLLLLPAAALGRAEIVDRVAVSVGRQAITESSLLRELRLTAMMNEETPDFSPASKRRTLERMIEQTLLRREMELSRYQMPEAAAVDSYLERLKKPRFRTEADYQQALEKHRLQEDEFRDYLRRQIATLRFLEIRFQPGIQITEAETRQYYEKEFLAEWQNMSKGPAPSFEEARTKVEAVLTAQRLDQLVDDWLKETRGRTRIEIQEQVLK